MQTSIAEGTPQNFTNRTPSAGMQTSIAEGTPRSFGNRTPSAGMQTSIAEGTPAPFGNRTPSAGMMTAIAEGTPASAFRGSGRGNILAAVAGVLAIDQTELQTELKAPGATLATVAAAHQQDRATFSAALLAALQQRVNDAVTNGTITQDTADQMISQYQANIDSLLDGTGGGGGGAPPANAAP
jgi:hypothetical protein